MAKKKARKTRSPKTANPNSNKRAANLVTPSKGLGHHEAPFSPPPPPKPLHTYGFDYDVLFDGQVRVIDYVSLGHTIESIRKGLNLAAKRRGHKVSVVHNETRTGACVRAHSFTKTPTNS